MNVFVLSLTQESTDFYSETNVELVTTDKKYAFMRMNEIFTKEKNEMIQEYGENANIETHIDENEAVIYYERYSDYFRCTLNITENPVIG